MHKGVSLDPHWEPVQVGNALDDVDGHGGHFCSLHWQWEQTCLEGFTHQSQPPKTAFDTNCLRGRNCIPWQAQAADYRACYNFCNVGITCKCKTATEVQLKFYQTPTQDGIQGQGTLPEHLLVARDRGALLAGLLVEVCQHHIDLQTAGMWGGQRTTKKGHNSVFRPACLYLGRTQHNLHFWEHSKVPWRTKWKLWLLSEHRNKIYILLYVHSAPWICVLQQRSQKMGKYTMPRRICTSLNQSLPGISVSMEVLELA